MSIFDEEKLKKKGSDVMFKNTIICTVGRSLLSNFERLNPDLKNNFSKEYVVKELLNKNPSDKLCGAEINSTYSLVKKEFIQDNYEIFLLVSDTEDGRKTGEILKNYFENEKSPLQFQQVVIKEIKGLTGEEKIEFKNKGLKEIANTLVDLSSKSPETTIINATGGYKAQISFATLIGQILKIPVYYMFEQFDEIIELPPMPVSFDYSLWIKNYDLLESLERLEATEEMVRNADRELRVLFDFERGGNERIYGLTPMGIIFHKTFKERFKRETNNLPQKRTADPQYISNSREPNSARFDEQYGISKKLLEIPYIRRLRCFYYNPDSDYKTKVNFREDDCEIYFTKNGKTIGFSASTTARTEEQKLALKIHLEELMKRW